MDSYMSRKKSNGKKERIMLHNELNVEGGNKTGTIAEGISAIAVAGALRDVA